MKIRARAGAVTAVVLAGVVAALTTGSAYAVPSVSVQAPATAKANTELNVVYAGQAEPAPGATGMILQLFYEPKSAGCAPTAKAQGERAGSERRPLGGVRKP